MTGVGLSMMKNSFLVFENQLIMEYTAIACPTQEIYNAVVEKTGLKLNKSYWKSYGVDTVVHADQKDQRHFGCYGSGEYAKDIGCTVISYEQFFKEAEPKFIFEI